MNEVIQRFEEMKQDHMKEQSAWIEYLSDELKKERTPTNLGIFPPIHFVP